jgi:hypothetical protein
VLGIFLATLPQRLLDVEGGQIAGHDEVDEPARRRQHLAVANIPQQAAGRHKSPVRHALEWVDGDVVLKRPDRRHDVANVGNRRMHPLDVTGECGRSGAGYGVECRGGCHGRGSPKRASDRGRW